MSTTSNCVPNRSNEPLVILVDSVKHTIRHLSDHSSGGCADNHTQNQIGISLLSFFGFLSFWSRSYVEVRPAKENHWGLYDSNRF